MGIFLSQEALDGGPCCHQMHHLLHKFERSMSVEASIKKKDTAAETKNNFLLLNAGHINKLFAD